MYVKIVCKTTHYPIILKNKIMTIKKLIEQLKQVENQNKYIHLLGNSTNGEDEDFDMIFNNKK